MKEIVILCLIIWGVVYFFKSSPSSYRDTSTYNSDYPNNKDEHDQGGLTFHGSDCTNDCSGHEAGYNWAEENNISDEDDCDGRSESFNEGCQTYVEENSDNNEDE